MSEKEKLIEICQKALEEKGLKDVKHEERLEWELKEIDGQNEHGYFLDLYEKKIKYPKNENNLLVVFLLGLTSDFDIDKGPECTFGDWPDVDIDYLPQVRDYLKNTWAPREYGIEHVSSIGSYNTFGIKSSLQNMARVHGRSRHEIVDLTTQIGLKDDDGKALTWDKALEMYPLLKKYCEENQDVAEAARRMLNRNNSMGKHAGGLIISSKRIDNFVPLVKDRDGNPCSAWVEGLHGQDLGPMGLVKFDLLVITNLMQIAEACRLIKERYGLASICAAPGQRDWSDTTYLNDKKSLDLAARGDLKCIFQFDSDGIRSMVKEGGVDSFDDLVAYSALYRPSAMQMGMHKSYINRKRGKESYSLPDLLKPILGKTYGVMVYQETVMQILNVVGDIPLKDCEILRKAISKKNEEYFKKYKEMFITNGQKNLGWDVEKVIDLFKQVEAFSGYGFNKCLAGSTFVYDRVRSDYVAIEDLALEFSQKQPKVILDSYVNGDIVPDQVVDVFLTGEKEVYEIELTNGVKINCTLDHKFICIDGIFHTVEEIFQNNLEIISDGAQGGGLLMQVCKIKSIRYKGKEKTYNMTMTSEQHNYAVYGDDPNGNFVISRNSHSCAYCYISARLLWLKAHYPLEFFTAIFSCENQSEKLKDYKHEADRHNIHVMPVDINKSSVRFKICDDKIYFGLSNIKGVGEAVSQRIVDGQPYANFADFMTRFGTDASVLKPLIGLKIFGNDPVNLYKYYEWFKKRKKSREDRHKRFDKRCNDMREQLKRLLPTEWEDLVNFDEKTFVEIKKRHDEMTGVDDEIAGAISDYMHWIDEDGMEYNNMERIEALFKEYNYSVEKFMKKCEADNDASDEDFNPDLIEIDEKLVKIYSSEEDSERAYYGFLWRHPLEKSPDHEGGLTFENFRTENVIVGPVECMITHAEKKLSKNKKTTYYLLQVEDSNGESTGVQVWEDDWERFGEDLFAGQLVKLQLKAPDGGFKRYTLNGPPKHKRYSLPKTKEADFRVCVMRKSNV